MSRSSQFLLDFILILFYCFIVLRGQQMEKRIVTLDLTKEIFLMFQDYQHGQLKEKDKKIFLTHFIRDATKAALIKETKS